MTEKLCLQWNDFKDNVNFAFETLRKDSDFTDVTLACEDGQQLEVHKVILAASSPFYRNIFKRNKHAHPLIFMRNVKFVDLEAIIDFLYCGETNVFQENLDSFLALAEDLQLKGLMGGQANSHQQMKGMSSAPKDIKREQPLLQSKHFAKETYLPRKQDFAGAIATTTNTSVHELESTVKSMMTKTDRKVKSHGRGWIYSCNVWGNGGLSMNLQHHIESNHVEGIYLPCGLCDKTYRSRSSLQNHKRDGHKKELL